MVRILPGDPVGARPAKIRENCKPCGLQRTARAVQSVVGAMTTVGRLPLHVAFAVGIAGIGCARHAPASAVSTAVNSGATTGAALATAAVVSIAAADEAQAAQGKHGTRKMKNADVPVYV